MGSTCTCDQRSPDFEFSNKLSLSFPNKFEKKIEVQDPRVAQTIGSKNRVFLDEVEIMINGKPAFYTGEWLNGKINFKITKKSKRGNHLLIQIKNFV